MYYVTGKSTIAELDFDQMYKDLIEEKILKGSIKYFQRFDCETKKVVLGFVKALYDADMLYDIEDNYEIGILLANAKGALDTNLAYFKDYLEAGRKLARGNLFIYTLPTSPLAEAAITLGLNGPLIYMSESLANKNKVYEHATNMLDNKECDALALAYEFQGEYKFLIIEKDESEEKTQRIEFEEFIKRNFN